MGPALSHRNLGSSGLVPREKAEPGDQEFFDALGEGVGVGNANVGATLGEGASDGVGDSLGEVALGDEDGVAVVVGLGVGVGEGVGVGGGGIKFSQ